MARLATEKDFDFVKHSWSVCFDDPPEFVDWNFEYNYSAENTVIAEYGGECASVLQLMPYSMTVGEAELSARYVSGVATLPEFRGKGLVRDLFGFAIPEMQRMGADVSLLIPAVEGMYEKFGYRKVYDRCFIRTGELKDGIADRSAVPLERLNSIYLADVKNKGVYINRSRADWDRILTDLIGLSGGRVIMYDNGYALAYPKDGGFEVCEACGNVPINGERVEQMPIMARVINEASFGYDASDEAVTEKVFSAYPNGYINLLL